MADETTEQRIAQIIKEQNKQLQAQIEKENELAALRGESLKRRSQEREAIKKQVDLDDERLKNIQEALKLEKEGRENRLAILEAEIQSLENQRKEVDAGSHRALQLEEEIEQKKKSLDTSRDILEATDEELKKQLELLSVDRQRAILRDKELEAAENLADATEDLLGSVTGISNAWEKGSSFSERMLQSIVASRNAGGSLSEQISAITEKFKETFTLQNIGASLILKSIQATKELMLPSERPLRTQQKL
jgi:chromosome segregation ATPase